MVMIASVSLDLDNKWSYMKTHGDAGWETFPSYLNVVVPRILDLLRELPLTITFFVVGQDAERPENVPALRSIAEAGHEIANHSFHHEPWLHQYTKEQIVEEFTRSETSIEAATGRRTRGFRGPGFSYSRDVLQVLHDRGYLYDASTFPTFLGPIARAYYFLHSGLGRKEKDQRKELFGDWRAGFQRLRPYRWQLEGAQLLELPVTTMPWFKVPIHMTYIMYLATFSKALATAYFYSALNLCRLSGVQPSLLLHPLDFLGCDDEACLAFFPGMKAESAMKVELARKLLSWMSRKFECLTMEQHAQRSQSTALIRKV
jgi:peptidoglycan-N-acetylglucosamine deacetylase